jgi:carbonic anhydrase
MSGLYKTLPPGEKSLGARHLAEVSVLAEIAWLKEQANVKAAIEERGVQIHAFVFDKVEGRCVQLIEGEEGKS